MSDTNNQMRFNRNGDHSEATTAVFLATGIRHIDYRPAKHIVTGKRNIVYRELTHKIDECYRDMTHTFSSQSLGNPQEFGDANCNFNVQTNYKPGGRVWGWSS